MSLELIAIGIFVGIISGFFGVGGGMILVPLLMARGFDIKSAIGISVVQMVCSSIYGSYLNYRKGNLVINKDIWVGVGGLLGGLLGAMFTELVDEKILEYIFLSLIIFAIYRLIITKKNNLTQNKRRFSSFVLFVIGFFIGIISMMLGVGGSIILTPILIGFLHFNTKQAATAGLFFVVFSSLSGLFYKLSAGIFASLSVDVLVILSIAFAALVGSWIGIWLKEKVNNRRHKLYVIMLYCLILVLLIKRIFLYEVS